MKRLIALALLGAYYALTMQIAPAQAANCSSYSYTLTNGQVADATQVMANFNNILSCANNNLAKNGANSDITSLSGLSTPLSAAQGGTGQSTSIFATANTWTLNQTFAASTTSTPSINLPQGVAPSAPTNGDIWTTANGVFARINGATVSLNAAPTVHVRHQRATTLDNNETFADTTWTTRALETVVTNTVSGASLAANQITLPAGTYEVQIFAPHNMAQANVRLKHRLYNVTDAAVLLYSQAGVFGEPDASFYAQGVAPFIGQFTLSGTKAIRLDTYVAGTASSFAGLATSDGSPEVYIDVYLRKIG